MSTRITLLAHAATAAQRHLRFPDNEGIEPLAAGVAGRVMEQVGRSVLAWRGPERRAAETVDALGVSASPLTELRAWSMGAWTGRAVAEVAERESDAFNSWRAGPDAAPHGGESLNGLLGRVGAWLEQPETAASRTLVVADPAVIRAAIVCALDAGSSTFWRVDIRPLSLAVLQRTDGTWRVRAMGVEQGG
ncbi:MAG TPA: histidine phosphatase family protein [Acidimicrobiia bacterium]